MLLPRGHHLTQLVVKKAHVQVFHNGVREMLAELCSSFWIVMSRSLVKGILQQSRMCMQKTRREALQCTTTPSTSQFSCYRSPHFSSLELTLQAPCMSEVTELFCLYTCYVVATCCSPVPCPGQVSPRN